MILWKMVSILCLDNESNHEEEMVIVAYVRVYKLPTTASSLLDDIKKQLIKEVLK